MPVLSVYHSGQINLSVIVSGSDPALVIQFGSDTNPTIIRARSDFDSLCQFCQINASTVIHVHLFALSVSTPPFPKKLSNVPQKQFFTVFLEHTAFFRKIVK